MQKTKVAKKFPNGIKTVIVGDGAVGKTSLLISFSQSEFPETYVPTVFDNSNATILVDDVSYELQLWDTAGQEGYDRLRPLSYRNAGVFLLCYSIDDINTFKNISYKWFPEIRKHNTEGAPVILLGLKKDLRGKRKEEEEVSEQQGQQLAVRIHASSYLECSAKTKDNVQQVFQEAVRRVISTNRRRRRFYCNIL